MIITIGRKPFKGSLIDNVKVEECGGLNIEDTRIGTEGGRTNKGGYQDAFVGGTVDYTTSGVETDLTPRGRWAANVVISEGVVKILDVQSGIGVKTSHYSYKRSGGDFIGGIPSQENKAHWRTEIGGASRYFKVVK